ncbi:uncharacterized protein TNCV_2563611 [Trichonephila clavipes]|nr:uncharacterized protein TNCV_2563611 [Trichonephila clavipes]
MVSRQPTTEITPIWGLFHHDILNEALSSSGISETSISLGYNLGKRARNNQRHSSSSSDSRRRVKHKSRHSRCSNREDEAKDEKTFSLSNMSSLAFFAHTNVFHHDGQPVPVELSIASIPEDGTEPKVICITVDHSNLLTTDKDRRANRYINERLNLKATCPDPWLSNTWISASGASFVTWPKETEA